jgi:hypothetical protein
MWRRGFVPWKSDLMKGVAMGFIDDAKDAAETAGRKIKEGFEDTVDRVSDKIDEAKADAEVKKAEAERDSVHKRNEIKEEIRGDQSRLLTPKGPTRPCRGPSRERATAAVRYRRRRCARMPRPIRRPG